MTDTSRADVRKRPIWPDAYNAESLLREVDARLRALYGEVPLGSAPLGNKRNPLDELIYIQLSVRTRESAYRATYRALRALVGRRWEVLLRTADATALGVIGSGGMGQVKLERIRAQLEAIYKAFARYSLAPLRPLSTTEADAFLQSLPGVGPKVARCVLLYSLDRDVFPVDSNCFRVMNRLGLVPAGTHPKAAHDRLQALTPPVIRRALHVNLVHHGRAVCTPGVPRCDDCPLVSICPTGRAHLSDAPGS